MEEIVRRLHEARRVEQAKEILESKGYTIKKRLDEATKKDYSNMSESQLDDELDEVSAMIEEIESDAEEHGDYEKLMDRLEEISPILLDMEEYLSDEQYDRCEALRDEIRKVERVIEREASSPDDGDEYRSRGLSRSDFM